MPDKEGYKDFDVKKTKAKKFPTGKGGKQRRNKIDSLVDEMVEGKVQEMRKNQTTDDNN